MKVEVRGAEKTVLETQILKTQKNRDAHIITWTRRSWGEKHQRCTVTGRKRSARDAPGEVFEGCQVGVDGTSLGYSDCTKGERGPKK